MKRKLTFRTLLLCALSAGICLSVAFAFILAPTKKAQVSADGDFTAVSDFTAWIADDTVVGSHYSNDKKYNEYVKFLTLTEADGSNYTPVSSTPLWLYNGGVKDSNVGITFTANDSTGYADGNKINASYLSLRYSGAVANDGGSITVAPINDGYALTSVTITADSAHWAGNTSKACAHVVITSLGNETVSDYREYATALFTGDSRQLVYESANGFKSFYISNVRDSVSKDYLYISAITVTYKALGSVYDVTFDTDGGTAVAAQSIAQNGYATCPSAPTKRSAQAKYAFAGWFTDDTYETEFDFENTQITANTTVYGKFLAVENGTYAATFHTNGGTAVATQQVAPGGTVAQPSDPTKSATNPDKYYYTFDGWYADPDLTTAYDWETVLDWDIDIYAKWSKSNVATPSGVTSYDLKRDVVNKGDTLNTQWIVVKGFYGTNMDSAANFPAIENWDSYETFNQNQSKQQLILSVSDRKHGGTTYGLMYYKYTNCVLKRATLNVSLPEDSDKVITYVRVELGYWAESNNYLYVNGGDVAVDTETNANLSPKNFLEKSFNASDEITSFSVEAGDMTALHIFYVGFAENTAKLARIQASAAAELTAAESNYNPTVWATVKEAVDTAKENIAAATTISAANGYLATAREAIASIAENPHFTGVNVTLNESLAVNYYVYLPSAEQATVVYSYGNGEFSKTVDPAPSGTANVYKFTYDGVSPHRMGDEISVSLYIGEDLYAQKLFRMTDYFAALLNKTAEELNISAQKYAAMQTLIGDVTAYGAAAQLYKDYQTENLVSEGFEDYASEPTLAPSFAKSLTSSSSENACLKGASVYFDGENKLYLLINAAQTALDNISLEVSVGDADGVTFTQSDLKKVSDSVYALYTQSVKATEFAAAITVRLYEGETLIQTLTYSVQAYVYAKQNGNDQTAALVKALWAYGLSATAYANA